MAEPLLDRRLQPTRVVVVVVEAGCASRSCRRLASRDVRGRPNEAVKVKITCDSFILLMPQ